LGNNLLGKQFIGKTIYWENNLLGKQFIGKTINREQIKNTFII